MRRKWIILAALVFLGVVGWVVVVVTPPKVYSRDEVRATLEDLDPEWIRESESTIFIRPRHNIFQTLSHRYLGISGSAVSSGNVYGFRNGEARASFIVYHEGNNVEGISFRDSVSARRLMEQIQRKLPGIQCRIVSP